MSLHVVSPRYTLGYRLLFAFTIPLLLASLVILVDIILNPLQPEAFYGSVPYRLVGGLVIAPLTVLVGALCVRHSPGNVVGLLLVLAGVGSLFSFVRADAGLLLVNMLGSVGVLLFWTSFVLLGLYFPDGKPYFQRVGSWMGRGMLLILLVSFAAVILGQPHFTYTSSSGGQSGENPLYVPALEPLSGFGAIAVPVFASVFMLFVLVSLIARYRAAEVRERQQLKWFLWGFAIWLVPQVVNNLPGIPTGISDAIGVYGIVGAGLLPVVTVGPAILVHKLWDIDVIIRRTLVYSVLTATLAFTYWGGVVGLQALLRPLTGEGNDLAIVATTLVVAAIFLPLRRLIQQFIDRRFYRRKYDAAATLAAFGQVARDEVDLSTLAGRLVGVVDETMQPEQISLWVRPPGTKQT